MTDFDVIEQRLRRTFQAVAEQPIPPIGFEDEPWHTDVSRPPPHRRGRLLVGTVALAIVIAAVSLGVIYGPRSANNDANPATSSPAASTVRAVFAPVSTQSHAVLEEIVATMTARLQALGDVASFSVQGGSIEVSGTGISQADLRLVATTGALSVRPVLCGAPAYVPPATGTTALSTPCQDQYALTAANLAVNSATGLPSNVVQADPSFTNVASTPSQSDYPAGSVLLPADPSTGVQEYPRFVLGAAQLGGSEIASASVQESGNGPMQWLVVLAVKPTALTAWDAVAQSNFHQYLGFDVDGEVISAPLIEPNETSFTSFQGQISIGGNFTADEAKGFAAVLGNGPMPVALKLVSLTRGSAALGSGAG
jgi:hypothetical protein